MSGASRDGKPEGASQRKVTKGRSRSSNGGKNRRAGRGERRRKPRRGARVILEGIVTTLSPDGTLNVAPMGPRIDPDMNMTRFVLRPFHTSTTYHNLKARGEGVFHVTDDVLLLAQTAIGAARNACAPAGLAADAVVAGQILDRCLSLLRVPGSRTLTTGRRTDGNRRRDRGAGRLNARLSLDLIGPSTPWSRRRFWQLERTGFPSMRSWSSFGSWRFWSTRPVGRASERRLPLCTGMYARSP